MSGSLFKVCPDCKLEKAVTDFGRNSAMGDGLQFYCKACTSLRAARNYRERRLRSGLSVREKVDVPDRHKYCPGCRQVVPHEGWHRSRHVRDGFASHCKACRRERQRRDHLKRTFGLTPEELQTLIASQGGVCAICDDGKPEHIDHDHETGRIRGVLCGPCNMGLGLFKDDPRRLEAAVDYLHRARIAASIVEVEHTDIVLELDSRRLHAA
jgi:hypothetical protein